MYDGLLRGVIPVAPVIFREDEQLDRDGQRRVMDYLVDSGAAAICILANYSEQFSLSDSERRELTDLSMEQIGGRVPVVVTTSHYSVRIARERNIYAKSVGAAMVMMMPPFFGATMSLDTESTVEYFERVADGIDLDIMIQDAPLSTTPLSRDAIERIATAVPQVRYIKVETPRAADKIRALGQLPEGMLPGLYDGEEAVTLIPDLNAGAQGTMCSGVLPFELSKIVSDYHAGRTEEAEVAWETLLPLIHFENRQCGLGATKIILKEAGLIHSDTVRSPLSRVPAESREQLLTLARRHDLFALRS
ncbi:MAG: dihydrodipicolinate synthase family protein [Acidobacteria bacterium]|nr:dihydrodipicolinate synthase family protein [Acidobacteriota bacterium]